jgi:hypothetical protein
MQALSEEHRILTTTSVLQSVLHKVHGRHIITIVKDIIDSSAIVGFGNSPSPIAVMAFGGVLWWSVHVRMM